MHLLSICFEGGGLYSFRKHHDGKNKFASEYF